MHCKICGKYIFDNAHYIDGEYYHNDCIKELTSDNEKILNLIREIADDWDGDDVQIGVLLVLENLKNLFGDKSYKYISEDWDRNPENWRNEE